MELLLERIQYENVSIGDYIHIGTNKYELKDIKPQLQQIELSDESLPTVHVLNYVNSEWRCEGETVYPEEIKFKDGELVYVIPTMVKIEPNFEFEIDDMPYRVLTLAHIEHNVEPWVEEPDAFVNVAAACRSLANGFVAISLNGDKLITIMVENQKYYSMDVQSGMNEVVLK